MGEAVFCSICSMAVGVRLVCCVLLLIHIFIGILPFLSGNIYIMANFFEFVFCSNMSVSIDYTFKNSLPFTTLSCNSMQSFLSGICVAYCMAVNLIMLAFNASLLVSGWSSKWTSLSYTAIHLGSAAQLVWFGSFVIFHFADRQEVGCTFNT